MFSKMTLASLPKDFPPRSPAEQILARARILPDTSSFQEVDELPVLDQAIQDAKKGMAVPEKVNVTPFEEKSVKDEPLIYSGKQ